MKDDICKKTIWCGLAALILFAPLVRGSARLWPMTAIELTVLALVFVWFWRMNNRTAWEFKRTSLDIPLFMFLILAFLSVIFSVYLRDSLYAMGRFITVICVYYLAVHTYDKKVVTPFAVLIVMTGAALSSFGLLQYFSGLPHPWWADERFISSTYVNHNHFAGYLELAMPLAVGLLVHRKDILSRFILMCMLIVMAAAFIFARSRGAWVSLALAVFILVFFFSRKISFKAHVFILVLFALFLTFTVFHSRGFGTAGWLRAVEGVKGDASFSTRLKIWQGTLDMIRHNPLIGVGFGALRYGFPAYRPMGLYPTIIHAHNDYLHMIAEMGLLSLPLMIWMVYAVLKKGYRMACRPVFTGAVVGLTSIFLHGMVDFNFHIPANLILVSLLSAFIIMEQDEDKNG